MADFRRTEISGSPDKIAWDGMGAIQPKWSHQHTEKELFDNYLAAAEKMMEISQAFAWNHCQSRSNMVSYEFRLPHMIIIRLA